MTMRKSFLRVGAAALMLVGMFAADPAYAGKGQPPDIEILLVGSSLVRGVKPTLKKLYKSIGLKAKIKAHGPARWTLAKHASSPRTTKIIRMRRWDYVFLAQSSVGILDVDLPDAAALKNKVVANGSTPELMMTWFGPGAALTLYDWLKGFAGAPFGYIPIALELGIPIAPAGWGIRNALSDGTMTALWRNGQHLSPLGRYLVGTIVFTTLTKQNPVGAGLWAPGKFSVAQTNYIHALVNDTVLSNPSEWNIALP